MTLTKQQEEELFANTIVACEAISWIRERLQKGDETLEEHSVRLRVLEGENAILKGKLGAFVLGLTFFVTFVVNSILWMFSHFWGKS